MQAGRTKKQKTENKAEEQPRGFLAVRLLDWALVVFDKPYVIYLCILQCLWSCQMRHVMVLDSIAVTRHRERRSVSVDEELMSARRY